jgi:hypothetical protein
MTAHRLPIEPQLLTPQALADRWQSQISLVTLATWRSRKQGPKYIKLGGRVLYPLDGVEDWEKKRTFCG